MEGLKKNMVDFNFQCKVSEKEYEQVIFPAIKELAKEEEKMRVLCYFAEDTKVSLGAMWEDTLIGFKHYFDWEKMPL